jgi:hypothetical protein
MLGKGKMMEIVDPPLSYAPKSNTNVYILCEGFKYGLREWRRWTHDEIVINNDEHDEYDEYNNCENDGYNVESMTRGSYSMLLISVIDEILYRNGYVLKYSTDSMARRFMHYWLQLYKSNSWNARLSLGDSSLKSVDMEDWDELFPSDFWRNIVAPFSTCYAFDDSYVGQELLSNIGWFFWRYIDGKKSPAIIKKREEERVIEMEMRKWRDDLEGFNAKAGAITSKDDTNEDIEEKKNEDNKNLNHYEH